MGWLLLPLHGQTQIQLNNQDHIQIRLVPSATGVGSWYTRVESVCVSYESDLIKED
jgi:hypothetical protein